MSSEKMCHCLSLTESRALRFWRGARVGTGTATHHTHAIELVLAFVLVRRGESRELGGEICDENRSVAFSR